jgi:hypothetical protein
MTKLRLALAALLVGLVASAPVPAAPPPRGPYEPYAFLIGSWDFGPESGGPAQGRMLFRWGPGKSYIWFATSLLADGKELPHFEGLLMWNGDRKDLDMLVALELNGAGAQEQGTVSVKPDGIVVREITSIAPTGTKGRFRQTFQASGPDRIRTTVMRETARGWVATFPGSDRLVMTRRKEGAGGA